MQGDYIISKDELVKLTEDASVSNAIKGLAEILSGRANDLPHRFRAPQAFAEYMQNWGVNSTYHTVPLHSSNPANGIIIEMTTRPTQGILEMIFQSYDGTRLFTLEIEYAVQKEG